MTIFKCKIIFFGVLLLIAISACQKATTAPSVSGVSNLIIVNAIPNSAGVIPVLNTAQPANWFASAFTLYNDFQYFNQYSPISGNDTVYVVQTTDTLDIGPKSQGQMYYGILPLKKGASYSLFLCGSDTTAPDYLFTTDTIPFHASNDSTVGIRFVNLSTGSNPISINLEGSSYGSEVAKLPYKSVTSFRDYLSNSSLTFSNYLFVVRDASSGDSLTSFSLNGFDNSNGVGLQEPHGFGPLVFKNVTIAVTGQPGPNAVVPQTAILIVNF